MAQRLQPGNYGPGRHSPPLLLYLNLYRLVISQVSFCWHLVTRTAVRPGAGAGGALDPYALSGESCGGWFDMKWRNSAGNRLNSGYGTELVRPLFLLLGKSSNFEVKFVTQDT